MPTEIIFGTQGRIEIEVSYTGIGTSFELYNCNNDSFSFGFNEGLPTEGPSNVTYTELLLNNLLRGKGSVSKKRGVTLEVKTIKHLTYIEGRFYSDNYKVVAFFNKEQLSILTNYLTNYVNALSQSIRNNTKQFQESCWHFYEESLND